MEASSSTRQFIFVLCHCWMRSFSALCLINPMLKMKPMESVYGKLHLLKPSVNLEMEIYTYKGEYHSCSQKAQLYLYFSAGAKLGYLLVHFI